MFDYFDYDYRLPPFSGMPFGQQSPPSGATGGSSGPPSSPPPTFTPQQSPGHGPGTFAVDPGAIRPCTFRYVYIWLNNGDSFWAWLVYVGRRSVAGWRWTGRRWVYFGIDLRSIESFTCF